jgi:hypothetical protein
MHERARRTTSTSGCRWRDGCIYLLGHLRNVVSCYCAKFVEDGVVLPITLGEAMMRRLHRVGSGSRSSIPVGSILMITAFIQEIDRPARPERQYVQRNPAAAATAHAAVWWGGTAGRSKRHNRSTRERQCTSLNQRLWDLGTLAEKHVGIETIWRLVECWSIVSGMQITPITVTQNATASWVPPRNCGLARDHERVSGGALDEVQNAVVRAEVDKVMR